MQQQHFQLTAAVLATAVLVGCGGGSDDVQSRGSLLADPNRVPVTQMDGTATTTIAPAQFGQILEATHPGLTKITGAPKCAISVYNIKYATVGGAGESTDSTGAILVPSGSDSACSGPRPVVLYAHGTETDKAFNMANIRDFFQASVPAATYAAQGFIVVAPNYAGYGTSSLGYHPYLNAEQQANDMVDGMRAAKKAFSAVGAQPSNKLLITGYSQGGHVSMATQRAMQTTYASEFQVTALASGAGPYAMSLVSDTVFAGSPLMLGTVFLPLTFTSYQKSYGGLYASPSDLYEAPYATGIESLLPGPGATITNLLATGKLPAAALFAADSMPGPSAPQFAPYFGPGNLIKSSFRTGYLRDAEQNPCNTAAGMPSPCTPAHPLRKAMLKNDLRTYAPNVPTMLCGGNADPVVFSKNTEAAEAYFLAKGMSRSLLTVLDVDSTPSGPHDPFASVKSAFTQAKAETINAAIAAKTDPAQAVAFAYHPFLVYPLCEVAARSYFQNVLAAQP